MNNQDTKNVQQENNQDKQDTSTTAQSASINKSVNEVEQDSYKEQFIRLTADFANYKRRVEKERLAWIQSGQVSIIKPFLQTVIDFDRAMAQASLSATPGKPNNGTTESFAVLQGFELIQKNMHKMLAELGIEQINCSGKFDPNLHEALTQIESPTHQSGDIAQVFSPGYIYKGEVIKHAQVGVAK